MAEAAINLDLRLSGAVSGLTGLSSGEKVETPAPFPLTSQIGTGGLSRQGSLRKSGGETPSGSSPTSERKSVPGSPTTPTGSSATSSTHGSPARFKMTMPNRKLATTRSSPQLVPSAPVLNQIHEEAEEGPSPASSISAKDSSVDPLDQFPSTPAGAVVIKRLEQRRRLRLLKARTASCSSSDASDDDSESRRKREQEISSQTPSPPPRAMRLGRDRQNDDSSDSQDPGLAGTGGTATDSTTTEKISEPGTNNEQSTTSSGRETVKDQSTNHRHRHHIRVRQSHSLNRISELHAEDFLLGCDADETSGLRQPVDVTNGRIGTGNSLQRQLSSESDSDGTTCDMLSRYLESLSANNRIRSRDDSLNSSDGEFEAGMSGHEQPRPPRRHKINLLSLEQRLNKIQASF